MTTLRWSSCVRSLVECMAATAGCGVVLNKQRVRLHSLLEVVISLTLMRYFFTVQMQFNQWCQWQLFFLSSFNGWIYGWNGRVWCDRKQTGRTLTLALIVLIVACCASAWSYNLALSHALFWCPNTLQSMAMTTLRWCLLADLLNVWNGYRVDRTARTFVFAINAIYVCTCSWRCYYWCCFNAVWDHSFTLMHALFRCLNMLNTATIML